MEKEEEEEERPSQETFSAGREEEKKRSATYRLIDSWCLPRMLALPFKELLLAGGRGIVARTTMKMSKNREQTALSTDPI